MKRRAAHPLSTRWMNLEEVILSEVSQAQKDERCGMTRACRLEKARLREAERAGGGAKGWGRGRKEQMLV